MPYIHKDSVLICQKCGDKILKTVRDLNSGDRIEAAMFEGIQYEISYRQRMVCKCGWDYRQMRPDWFVREDDKR